MTPALLAVIAYVAAQFGIGIWVSRRIRTESDYLVAGRSLGYVLATFSIFATWFGAETTVGSAGTAYREGLTLASAEPFGYGLCLIGMGLLFAVPLRRRGLSTLADLFRDRYSVRVERVAAVILVPSSILWAAAQVRAFGHVIATTTTALDPLTAIRIAAGFTILYTMFGGLMVDAIMDVVQGILLALGLLVIGVAVVHQLGGVENAIAVVRQAGRVRLAPSAAGPALQTLEAWAIPVFGSLLATELVGRVVATRTPTIARRSSVMAGVMYISIGLIPVFVGLVGPGMLPGLTESEQLMPTLARRLLPTFAFAIFAGGLVAAILSTVDSTLLTASALLSHNLLVPVLGVRDERVKVRLARGCVALFGVIAYVLALRAEGVFELVEQASAFGSAGTLVTVVFGLFTGIGGPVAALATLLVGALSYLVASYGGSSVPFLLSLAASLATYLVLAGAERVSARARASAGMARA